MKKKIYPYHKRWLALLDAGIKIGAMVDLTMEQTDKLEELYLIECTGKWQAMFKLTKHGERVLEKFRKNKNRRELKSQKDL